MQAILSAFYLTSEEMNLHSNSIAYVWIKCKKDGEKDNLKTSVEKSSLIFTQNSYIFSINAWMIYSVRPERGILSSKNTKLIKSNFPLKFNIFFFLHLLWIEEIFLSAPHTIFVWTWWINIHKRFQIMIWKVTKRS